MHWIQLELSTGRLTRGKANPPSGDVFFVSPTDCHAYLHGLFYKDGQPAPAGTHTITFDNGDTLPFTVGAHGQATRGAYVAKGGPAA